MIARLLSIFIMVFLCNVAVSGAAQSVWDTVAERQAEAKQVSRTFSIDKTGKISDPNQVLAAGIGRQITAVRGDMRYICLPPTLSIDNAASPMANHGVASAIARAQDNGATALQNQIVRYKEEEIGLSQLLYNYLGIKASVEATVSAISGSSQMMQGMMQGAAGALGQGGAGASAMGGNPSGGGLGNYAAYTGSNANGMIMRMIGEQNQLVRQLNPGTDLDCMTGQGTLKRGITETRFAGGWRVLQISTSQGGNTTTIFPKNGGVVIELAMGGGTTMNGMLFDLSNTGGISINKTNLDIGSASAKSKANVLTKVKNDLTDQTALHDKIMILYRRNFYPNGVNFLEFAGKLVSDAKLRSWVVR